MNRRQFVLTAAAGAAALARSRGMQVHLSPGAIGLQGTPGQILDWAAEYGFDVIDASPDCVAALDPSVMKSRRVGWAMAGLPVEFRREEPKFRQGMKDFPSHVARLRSAGVDRMTTWIMPASADRTYRENFRIHADRLREVAKVLNDSGIRFGIEYVGPKTLWASQRYPFIHTMREMRELIAEINVPNTGLVIDSWHWYHSRETAADIKALTNRDVVSVDLNDAPRNVPQDEMVDSKRELPASTGVIDVKSFLSALESIGFDGPVRAEPFNEAVRQMPPRDALNATRGSLKRAFAGAVPAPASN